MTNFNIAVCGMSHLGLTYSTAFASFGAQVLCFDADTALIQKLASGQKTVNEPNLYETIAKNAERQHFSANIADIKNCDIVYIALDVATDVSGNSDLSAVQKMIVQIVPNLNPKVILVVLCQVTPGFTRALSQSIPQKVYYQVETLVFGRAMKRALQPERYIVGCSDPTTGLDQHFKAWLECSKCPIMVMSYESAELSKIAINLFLISSVSTANMLAEMCEKIGADWNDIKPSLHLDKRIGPHAYLKPGLGISGGNLERDMTSIIKLGESNNTDTSLVANWAQQSKRRKQWVIDRLKEIYPDLDGLRIAIWGLAYKEDTNSIKNSPAIETIMALPQCDIIAHDPSVKPEQVSFHNVTFAADPLAALADADALLIMTPWAQYKNYAASELIKQMAGNIIIDPYGLVDVDSESDKPFTLYTMGKKPIISEGQACLKSRINSR